MAKNTKEELKKNSSAAKAGAKAETKEATKSVANPRLVAAFRQSDEAKKEYTSTLVKVAEIVQNESCTRIEVVLSMMEARGCTKQTAESQYSRMSKILKDEETLVGLRNGTIDLKTAREKTTKKQAAPNKEKQKDAVEKRFATALKKMLEAAKEGGYDLEAVLKSVKANAKKEGLK